MTIQSSYLRTLAIPALAVCLGACGMLGGDKNPDDAGVAAGAAAQPAAADYRAPNGAVKVDVVKPAHLASGNVLIVPTVYVRLPISGKVAVHEQGSALSTIGGGSANSVKASAEFKVKGLDKALAQRIAAAAYDDFVAQLRGAGYTVLTYADIRNRDVVKNADRAKVDAEWGLPVESVMGGGAKALLAAPSDEQAFEGGFAGGVFNQFIRFGKTKLDDGIVIIPQYTITAPQMWGEKGASYSSISAAVKGAPAMVLTGADAFWMTNKPKVEMMSGIPGVHLKGVAGLADKVGELTMIADTTSDTANALSKTLSFLTGTGSINSQSAKYEMTIDPAAYASAAVEGVRKFNAEVAKIAAGQRS